ncbi:MAG TPA: thiamine pyrophosphate-dependent enzyme [Gemmataceae bacterium]|jgi:thiamine pyrophosphate-dependent acetolactate synthase large subunit-like protein|nr:thiamine pyrophosphate-dependent enzyme [Gemmataceae bacterium]
MTHQEALTVLAAHRGDRIVLTTMGSVGIWPALSDTPLDFAYLPSSMGQGVAVGLGLALATGRDVVAITGDGSLLMNLGSLVTVANHPTNLTVVLIDNGLYEVTGGQDVVGARRINYEHLAYAAGFDRVYIFADLEPWQKKAAEVLSGPGPTFLWLEVDGERGHKTPSPPRPMAEQIQRLRVALAQ